MLVLLRSIQTLLLILAIGVGTWRPVTSDVSGDYGASIGLEGPASQAVSDSENEEKPSGETHDSDGEGAKDGQLLGINALKLDVPYESLDSRGCLNEELPLHGRDTTRELFRPPRS